MKANIIKFIKKTRARKMKIVELFGHTLKAIISQLL